MAPAKKNEKSAVGEDFTKIRGDIAHIRGSIAGIHEKMELLDLIAQKLLGEDSGKQVEDVKKLEEPSLMDLCDCWIVGTEEDKVKRQPEEEILASEDSNQIVSNIGGSLRKFDQIVDQIQLFSEEKKTEEDEIGIVNDVGGLLEKVDQIVKQEELISAPEATPASEEEQMDELNRNTKKRKRWKASMEIQGSLEKNLSSEELLHRQERENRVETERVRYACQVFDNMRLRGKRVRKKKRWKKLAKKIFKPYRKSERSRKIDGIMDKNVVRRLDCLVLEYVAEKMKSMETGMYHHRVLNRMNLLKKGKRRKKGLKHYKKVYRRMYAKLLWGYVTNREQLFRWRKFKFKQKHNRENKDITQRLSEGAKKSKAFKNLGSVLMHKSENKMLDLAPHLIGVKHSDCEAVQGGGVCNNAGLNLRGCKVITDFSSLKCGRAEETRKMQWLEICRMVVYATELVIKNKLKGITLSLQGYSSLCNAAVCHRTLLIALQQKGEGIMVKHGDFQGKNRETYTHPPAGLIAENEGLANEELDESELWKKKLIEQTLKLLGLLPKVMQEQLRLERDPHRNVQVDRIEIWKNSEFEWKRPDNVKLDVRRIFIMASCKAIVHEYLGFVSRMKEGQNAIYYITGKNKKTVEKSLFLAKLKKKSNEVINTDDAVDEYAIGQLKKFEGKKLISTTKEGMKREETGYEKKKKNELKGNFEGMCKMIKVGWGDKVEVLIVYDRVVHSASCLVTGKYSWTAEVERLVKAQALGSRINRLLKLDLVYTWEWQRYVEQPFLQYDLGDKVIFKGAGIDTIWPNTKGEEAGP